jgi:hypothetical protein
MPTNAPRAPRNTHDHIDAADGSRLSIRTSSSHGVLSVAVFRLRDGQAERLSYSEHTARADRAELVARAEEEDGELASQRTLDEEDRAADRLNSEGR